VKGFMRQRGSAWELRVFVGTDAVTGKKRYTTKTVRGGNREAQRALAQMVTHAELGLSARTSATSPSSSSAGSSSPRASSLRRR
jgi:hypothetical protein